MSNNRQELLNNGAAVGPKGEGRDSPSTLPTYPAYKDSGVEWLGAIPEHWSSSPLKRAFKIEGGSTPTPDEANWDGDIAWVTPADLSGLSSLFLGASKRTITPTGLTSCGTTLLPAGSLILSTRAPIGSLAIALISMCTNQGCKGLVPNADVSSNYFAYVLLTAKTELNNRGKGTTFLEISGDELGRFGVPTPPFPEQTQIARFLDHETARIDALIEEQQRLIELLKEKRQAVISHAVTKGLDPTVPMKDSGVEWLGEVPAHWVCKSYRYASRIYRGKFSHRPRNDPSLYDGDFAFIQTGDIARAEKYIVEYNQTLNEKGASVSQKFPSGTLVMAIAANVGDTAILGFEAYAPDSVVGFKPERGIELEFLRFSLMAALQELKKTSTQSTQANLNIDRISGINSVFPPHAEQRAITVYLNEVMERFSLLEKQAEASIELMNERRSALISAAVTGKIDVRGWQASVDAATASVP